MKFLDIITEWGKRGWKPSASQRREFAKNMKDDDFAKAYYDRKAEKESKRRSTSKYDYNSAGGMYIPTKVQYDFVMDNPDLFKTSEEEDAMNQVIYGYTTNTKIHHDHIHVCK